jgi:hypothetical protein
LPAAGGLLLDLVVPLEERALLLLVVAQVDDDALDLLIGLVPAERGPLRLVDFLAFPLLRNRLDEQVHVDSGGNVLEAQDDLLDRGVHEPSRGSSIPQGVTSGSSTKLEAYTRWVAFR